MLESGPQAKLVQAFADPHKLAIASARTCYSGKGLVYPEDLGQSEKSRAIDQKIASSTLKAGHLTTRQHAHFVFALSHLSRQAVWSFLHRHPFYNSEQVSQRYVEVKADQVVLPPLSSEGRRIYREVVARQMEAYQKLIPLLTESAADHYYRVFPQRRKRPDKWQGAIHKKAMEVARYVLPLGTATYLYHTIDGLTLHRYMRMAEAGEPSFEVAQLVRAMGAEVERWDPDFFAEMREPMPREQSPDSGPESAAPSEEDSLYQWRRNFDAALGEGGSVLRNHSQEPEAFLAELAGAVYGGEASANAGDLLDPAEVAAWAEPLNPGVIGASSQMLDQVYFTFQKKLSHTADSQEQRHRALSGARPLLSATVSAEPDYIVPRLIAENPAALRLFQENMEETFAGIGRLLALGDARDMVALALPNAFPVRLFESGGLMGWHHKWKLRSCYLAQEEIFYTSLAELRQVRERWPDLGRYLGPPCHLRRRAGLKPYCPEGDRFCGVRVWDLAIEDFERMI